MNKTKKPVTVLIACGGTAGHLLPAQNFARSLMNTRPDIKVVFIGSGISDNDFFNKKEFFHKEVLSATPLIKSPKQRIFSIVKLIKGVGQSIYYIKKLKPSVIVGFGSYHSFPPLFASRFMKTPICLFESNVHPGVVNRFCSRWAQLSAVLFPPAIGNLRSKSRLVTMPYNAKMVEYSKISKTDAYKYFGLNANTLTILVFGGSQGALVINQKAIEAFIELKKQGVDFQVIHIVGKNSCLQMTKKIYSEHAITHCVKQFEEHIVSAYKIADIGISRAGSCIFCAIKYSLPSIFIPYPYATENHQYKNAMFVTDNVKGSITIEQKELKSKTLIEKILYLINNNYELLNTYKASLEKYNIDNQTHELHDLISEWI